MDARALTLLLYSKSKAGHDIKTYKEIEIIQKDFKKVEWQNTIDIFFVPDDALKNKLSNFINSI